MKSIIAKCMYLMLCLTILTTGCQENQRVSSDSKDSSNDSIQPVDSALSIRAWVPEDGIYLIKEMGLKDELRAADSSEALVHYSYAFLDEPDTNVEYYLLQVEPFVPLRIQAAPTLHGTEKRLSELRMVLAPEYSELLEEFTRENTGKMVGIVIDGEVVTRHKVRMAIEGGRLKISRCTDHACEQLFTALEDNVEE